MAFRWRADDGSTLNAGLVFRGIRASTAKKACIFEMFRGGGGVRIPAPLWIRAYPVDMFSCADAYSFSKFMQAPAVLMGM